MQDYFNELMDTTFGLLQGDEFLLAGFTGENSDFIRLNKNRIRQAGAVHQMTLSLDLIAGNKHAQAFCNLIGDLNLDLSQLRSVIDTLREQRQYNGAC